eukprot:7654043-Pyramimonas_sp.AAC.1
MPHAVIQPLWKRFGVAETARTCAEPLRKVSPNTAASVFGGPFWNHLGVSWGPRGASFGAVGALLGLLGGSKGSLG